MEIAAALQSQDGSHLDSGALLLHVFPDDDDGGLHGEHTFLLPGDGELVLVHRQWGNIDPHIRVLGCPGLQKRC